MSIDHVQIVDAALLPVLEEDWLNTECSDVAHACRDAARLVAVHNDTGQSYRVAKRYAGSEWRNAVLRSLLMASDR